jgi:hypothetical protein
MERLTHDVACIDLLHAKFAYTAAAPYLRNYNTQKHNKDLGCYLKVSCGTLNSSSSSFHATLHMGNEELALDMAPGSLHKHVRGEILWP